MRIGFKHVRVSLPLLCHISVNPSTDRSKGNGFNICLYMSVLAFPSVTHFPWHFSPLLEDEEKRGDVNLHFAPGFAPVTAFPFSQSEMGVVSTCLCLALTVSLLATYRRVQREFLTYACIQLSRSHFLPLSARRKGVVLACHVLP